MRYRVLTTYPGVALLVLNMGLFLTSFTFLRDYDTSPCVAGDLVNYMLGKNNVPGSFYVMIHAALIEVIGLFTIIQVVASFLLKLVFALGFALCPIKQVNLKKKLNTVPEDLKYIRKRVSLNIS